MSEQFKEQGGVATMDPSPLRRWLNSKVMSRLSTEQTLHKRRNKRERKRAAAGRPHEIEYFHQVEDGYSHLAAQLLPRLAQRYNVSIVCHLVSGPSGNNSPEPELLLQLSRSDATLIANQYGLEFPATNAAPLAAATAKASEVLANLNGNAFVQEAQRIGAALWNDDEAALESLQGELGRASNEELKTRLEVGNERRRELKHYSGAMFFYEGEWYWGVDRLHHLEKRLIELGLDQSPSEPPLAPQPQLERGPLKDDGSLTLEIYPSLRSPYTAISFDRAVSLAQDSGVSLSIRPVLPMVMRGVPATMEKGMYIFTDAAREARATNVPYGNFYDPIGEPARRAYSLYPWADSQGKSAEFISAFLRCAFAHGVNTNKLSGLRKVVEQAGLDWSEAQSHLGSTDWEQQLEANRVAMYDSGLWGVPSFRLLNSEGVELLALWGQDRLWLIAREVQRQLAARGV